jgi:hypothetical protein
MRRRRHLLFLPPGDRIRPKPFWNYCVDLFIVD